jgi:hypothetical protein
MAISRHFLQRRRQGAGGMLRAAGTALFDGSHDPKAPRTKGSGSPRQLYFSIFLAWPASRDSVASNVMVRLIMIGGGPASRWSQRRPF